MGFLVILQAATAWWISSYKRMVPVAPVAPTAKSVDAIEKSEIVASVEEPVGISERLLKQKGGGPFYCGTAFCGHSTRYAAAKCWHDKGIAMKKAYAERDKLQAEGKLLEAHEAYKEIESRFYPETNPANWPCNRSTTDMVREYNERAKTETR